MKRETERTVVYNVRTWYFEKLSRLICATLNGSKSSIGLSGETSDSLYVTLVCKETEPAGLTCSTVLRMTSTSIVLIASMPFEREIKRIKLIMSSVKIKHLVTDRERASKNGVSLEVEMNGCGVVVENSTFYSF